MRCKETQRGGGCFVGQKSSILLTLTTKMSKVQLLEHLACFCCKWSSIEGRTQNCINYKLPWISFDVYVTHSLLSCSAPSSYNAGWHISYRKAMKHRDHLPLHFAKGLQGRNKCLSNDATDATSLPSYGQPQLGDGEYRRQFPRTRLSHNPPPL